MKELLGHANIKTTDTYLNATRIGLQESIACNETLLSVMTNRSPMKKCLFHRAL